MTMPRGRITALRVTLTDEERRILRYWLRVTTLPVGQARRARMILLLADGRPISTIAEKVGMSRNFVYKWTTRFLHRRIDGLYDLPTHPRLGAQRAMPDAARDPQVAREDGIWNVFDAEEETP